MKEKLSLAGLVVLIGSGYFPRLLIKVKNLYACTCGEGCHRVGEKEIIEISDEWSSFEEKKKKMDWFKNFGIQAGALSSIMMIVLFVMNQRSFPQDMMSFWTGVFGGISLILSLPALIMAVRYVLLKMEYSEERHEHTEDVLVAFKNLCVEVFHLIQIPVGEDGLPEGRVEMSEEEFKKLIHQKLISLAGEAEEYEEGSVRLERALELLAVFDQKEWGIQDASFYYQAARNKSMHSEKGIASEIVTG